MKTYSEVLSSEPLTTFSWALGKMPVITMVSVTVSVTASVKTSAKRGALLRSLLKYRQNQCLGGTPLGRCTIVAMYGKRCFACYDDHRQYCFAVVTRRRCAAGSCRFGHAKCAPLDARTVQVRTLELRTLGRTICAHSGAEIVHIRTPDV